MLKHKETDEPLNLINEECDRKWSNRKRI